MGYYPWLDRTFIFMGFFSGLYQLRFTRDKKDEERKVEVHAKEIEWYEALIHIRKKFAKEWRSSIAASVTGWRRDGTISFKGELRRLKCEGYLTGCIRDYNVRIPSLPLVPSVAVDVTVCRKIIILCETLQSNFFCKIFDLTNQILIPLTLQRPQITYQVFSYLINDHSNLYHHL